MILHLQHRGAIGPDYSENFTPVSAKYIRLYINSATNVNVDYFTVTGGSDKTLFKNDIKTSSEYKWNINSSYGGLSGYFTIEKSSNNKVIATSSIVNIKTTTTGGGDSGVTIEGGYTGPSCDGTGTGAYYTGEYRNLFAEKLGKTDAEVETKINNVWKHFFTPGSSSSVYYEVGNDMA